MNLEDVWNAVEQPAEDTHRHPHRYNRVQIMNIESEPESLTLEEL